MKSSITAARRRPLLLLLGAGLLLNVLLIAPLWLRFGFGDGRWLAWEAWLLAAGFALLPDRRATRLLRWLAVVVVMTAVILGLSDGAIHQVLSRPLNLYFDINLLSASFHLLDGNLGRVAAVLIFAAVLLLLFVLAWVVARVLAISAAHRRPDRIFAGAVAFSALLLGAMETQGLRLMPVARTPVWDTLSFQLEQVRSTHRARIAFVDAAPDMPRPAEALSGLADTDVLMIFIESYGATIFELDRYRQLVTPTLERMQGELEQAGVSVVSGLLESPIRGGQSWLSHATALSGRWIDNQLWYRLLLESHHNSLIDDFRATGHQTMAVMPAIIMPWPEGRQLGFDRIFAARDLDYAGPALNWVTMPDQYTLHRFQDTLRPQAAQPLFAQIALISSHAPWTPILDVLPDWDGIADGAVFERWRDAGQTPQELWQDIERVRDHFARSVDYSIHVSLDFAARFVDDNTLMILLGDHQPATLITGHEASDAVPVHVISKNPRLLKPFRQRGFVDGLVPDHSRPAAGMDRLRDWLHEDFGNHQATP
ncbi:sulfatase-like hydrolase/transferase [Wenzhouxiangella limi]|uniref:sulfatase-like hydrolase/transferase n=1 Tax=Wenzhouxiangella limi TaxID=2707351 RepID=UPI0019449AE5